MRGHTRNDCSLARHKQVAASHHVMRQPEPSVHRTRGRYASGKLLNVGFDGEISYKMADNTSTVTKLCHTPAKNTRSLAQLGSN